MVIAPTARTWLVGCILTLPLAALACTAGDPINYQGRPLPSAPAVESDGAAPDAGPSVRDSSADVQRSPFDAATPIPSFACSSGLGGECDPTAGMGCCLKKTAGPTGDGNVCFDQLFAFSGASCADPGDVFLACLSSDSDNTCCWSSDGDGRVNTRYRAACNSGPEACDPHGGTCTTGEECKAVTCKGVLVGYCGQGAPPCQP